MFFTVCASLGCRAWLLCQMSAWSTSIQQQQSCFAACTADGSYHESSSDDHEYCPEVEIHPPAAEIIQSGPKLHRQTNGQLARALV